MTPVVRHAGRPLGPLNTAKHCCHACMRRRGSSAPATPPSGGTAARPPHLTCTPTKPRHSCRAFIVFFGCTGPLHRAGRSSSLPQLCGYRCPAPSVELPTAGNRRLRQHSNRNPRLTVHAIQLARDIIDGCGHLGTVPPGGSACGGACDEATCRNRQAAWEI